MVKVLIILTLLVCVQPVASEAIRGNDKAKIHFKVVGPIKDP